MEYSKKDIFFNGYKDLELDDLILDEEEFDKKLISHKKLITKLARKHKVKPENDDDHYLFQRLKIQARELSLVSSRFRCEKCSFKERLSWHHLVLRKSKEYMPFSRYLSARHYWNNLIILCWPCHKEYHGIEEKGRSEKETEISKELINRLKARYFVTKE